MRPAVVILSKNIDNLRVSLSAVQDHEPGMRIIVVDDGLLERPGGALYARGAKPFVFARNANIGIDAACDADVILLNDDAVLTTPGGFTAMQKAWEANQEYGVLASSCNTVGNINQHRQADDGIRDEPRQLCFVCVLLPRPTIDRIGLLDERFVGYGMDDDDYSRRVTMAGLKLGVYDGCFVDHGSLVSTYRGKVGGGDYRPNLKLFIDKWGVDNFGRPPS